MCCVAPPAPPAPPAPSGPGSVGLIRTRALAFCFVSGLIREATCSLVRLTVGTADPAPASITASFSPPPITRVASHSFMRPVCASVRWLTQP